MTTMNAKTEKQRLLVIFTCADEMIPELPDYNILPGTYSNVSLKSYVVDDAIANTEFIAPYFDEGPEYAARMYTISKALENYTRTKLKSRKLYPHRKQTFCFRRIFNNISPGLQSAGRWQAACGN